MTDRPTAPLTAAPPPGLLEEDAALFVHQHGSSPCLGVVTGARGIRITLEDGRSLIDLHGNTAHHLGYGHPRLIAAVTDQMARLPFSPRRYANAPATALARRLVGLWPGDRARVLFATGGSDAIEIAMKLARVATGRPETISLEGSYHGHGFGAFGLSRAVLDERLGRPLPGRHHARPYWTGPDGPQAMLADIERLLATHPAIGAVIAEPIRSNCHVPPRDLWPEVRRLCDRHGAKLVFDEIPSGLGKTGRFFAFDHVGALPDAVVLGKALGGGLLPIAAVIADEALNVAPELSLGHYTHEKNPVTATAALTTLDIILGDGLVARAGTIERRLRERLAPRPDTRAAFAAIDHVRGLGALLAVGLDRRTITAPIVTVIDALAENGLSSVAKDERSFSLSLPLVTTDDEIDEVASRIERTLGALPS